MPRNKASTIGGSQRGGWIATSSRSEWKSLACVNRCDYTGEMIRPSARQNLTKSYLLYRAEIGQFHPEPEPFGWRIYTGTDKDPISRSATGFSVECDAWNAAVVERTRIERMSLH